MSVNRHRPHLFVLPEDDANREIANGFVLELGVARIRLLEQAGGWLRVVDALQVAHVAELRRYPHRVMVLLLDFDGHYPARLDGILRQVPPDVRNRVFVLGAATEPEHLPGLRESTGRRLARECREDRQSESGWAHALLQHNAAELARMRDVVRPILFS